MISEPEITWDQVKNGLAAAEREYQACKWWQLRRRRLALRKVEGFAILMRAFERNLDRHGL